MQPDRLCPPHRLFLTVSWEEQSFPSRAESGAGHALQLTQAGEESHQTVLVPGHLVLLRALVVCARLVSSGNRRSWKCQRGGLTNSAGINFNECMFLRKTAKLKKKIKSSCVCFPWAAVHNG